MAEWLELVGDTFLYALDGVQSMQQADLVAAVRKSNMMATAFAAMVPSYLDVPNWGGQKR